MLIKLHLTKLSFFDDWMADQLNNFTLNDSCHCRIKIQVFVYVSFI